MSNKCTITDNILQTAGKQYERCLQLIGSLNNIISNNVMKASYYPFLTVCFEFIASSNNMLSDNLLYDFGNAIWVNLGSMENTIKNNEIKGKVRYNNAGVSSFTYCNNIGLIMASKSNHNKILCNKFTEGYYRFETYDGEYIDICWDSIILSEVFYNILTKNHINNGDMNIELGASNNEIMLNEFNNIGFYIYTESKWLDETIIASSNQIYHNNFIITILEKQFYG